MYPGARSARVTMYLLGISNEVIIEATCSCNCLLGDRENIYF